MGKKYSKELRETIHFKDNGTARIFLANPKDYFEFIDRIFGPWGKEESLENYKIEKVRLIYLMGLLCLENKMDDLLVEYCLKTGKKDKLKEAIAEMACNSKIKILKKWGLIENHTKQLLSDINKARNNAAHNIDFVEKKYCGKGMLEPKTVQKFRHDVTRTFGKLEAWQDKKSV